MGKISKHVISFEKSHLKAGDSILVSGEGFLGKMFGKGKDTQHNGVLIVTKKTVAFYRKGLLGEVIETIPLDKITSIERKSTVGMRTIRIHTSNDKLEFTTLNKEEENGLIEALETGRESHEKSNDPNNDILDSIERLAKLREQGILSEEEFSTKKSELLSKM